MHSLNIPDEIDQDRRRFFGAAAMAVAATQFGLIGPAQAQQMTGEPAASFGPLKRIEAGVLSVGYAELDRPTARPSSCYMAGHMTSTPMPMSPLCWQRKATA